MATKPQCDVGRAFVEGTPIDEALNQAVRAAVELHKRMGLPMAIWRDGRVAWITAEEVEREQQRCDDEPSP
jgi:hypothetical protein